MIRPSNQALFVLLATSTSCEPALVMVVVWAGSIDLQHPEPHTFDPPLDTIPTGFWMLRAARLARRRETAMWVFPLFVLSFSLCFMCIVHVWSESNTAIGTVCVYCLRLVVSCMRQITQHWYSRKRLTDRPPPPHGVRWGGGGRPSPRELKKLLSTALGNILNPRDVCLSVWSEALCATDGANCS
jgi:hypothetical protein